MEKKSPKKLPSPNTILHNFDQKVQSIIQKPGIKKLLLAFWIVLLCVNFLLAARNVLQSNIHLPSDVGRDFLLFQEISDKKLILIGGRTSSNFYHGPLWWYVNYPAYAIGNGNPLVVGWYWIFLGVIFTISGFFIAKKLFDTTTAYLFTLVSSLYLGFHTHAFINPDGAMMMIPAFFYFFMRYTQTLKVRYLAIALLVVGCTIQFQMAFGIPFAILSFFYALFWTHRKKKLPHMLIFVLLILPVSNYILFDLRHEFLVSKKIMEFVSPVKSYPTETYQQLFFERIDKMVSGEFLRVGVWNSNYILSGIFLLLLLLQVKDKKNKQIYLSFLYFYTGYFLLSLINKGYLLYFYVYPLFPFIFLVFSSFVTSRYKNVFLILFFVLYFLNVKTLYMDYLYERNNIIGKEANSWKFLKPYAETAFQGPEKEFGYFLYSPDSVSYQTRYTMYYVNKIHGNPGHAFKKMPITYIVVAPPPPDNLYMQDAWWTEYQVGIKKKPVWVKKFDNGYKMEKYSLTADEIKVPFPASIDTGLNFR